MNTAISTEFRCPGCYRPVGPEQAHCPGCGIWLAGPHGAELRWIDGELKRVDAARTWLISRRAALLVELTAMRRQAATPAAAEPRTTPDETEPGPGAPATAGGEAARSARGWYSERPAGSPSRPELSTRTAARLLLSAGAALVVIAVIVFTVADWARIGPLGRCGILLAATVIVLAAPPPLLRRGLNATAESIAAIGMGLTVADAFLFERLIPLTTGPIAAAAGTAGLAAVWAGYGAVVRLRGPRLAAIGLAQLPLPLAIIGLVRLGGPGIALAGPIAGALVIDSAADLAVARWAERAGHGAEAAMSSTAAVTTWVCGVLAAAAGLGAPSGLVAAAGRSGVIWPAGAMIAAAMVALVGPRGSLATLAKPAAAMSGVLLAVGLALPVAEFAPAGWELAVAACSSGLVGVVALALGGGAARQAWGKAPQTAPTSSVTPPTAASRDEFVAAGAAVVLAASVLLALPAAIAGLFPARWPLPAWSGPAAQYTSAGFSVWPGTRTAAVVLALAALACWLAPARAGVRARARAGGLAASVIAVASLPATARLVGWTALAVPTAAAVILLAVGAVQSRRQGTMRRTPRGDQALACVAAIAGTAAAASAALRSLGTPAATIAELTVLTAAFCASAALTRQTFGAAVSTACALATATGLACAVPLALGWPARYAAFAALAVAVAAIGAATRLRATRPVQSVVLDAGAVAVTLICAGLTAGWRDEFALVAVAAALAASMTAWLRTGARRQLALVAAACGVLGALTAQWRPLATVLLAPGRMITQTWRGDEFGYLDAGRSSGLVLAVVVLAMCLAALATAAGAWRGSRHASLDAVALALPIVAAPAGVAGTTGLAGGLGYWLTVGTLLALTLTLTVWATLGRSAAPRAAALVAAALTIAWAVAAPLPTLVVLGCLTVAYPLAAWRARNAIVKAAAAALSVAAAAGLLECVVLAAHGAAWHAGLAVLGVAAAAQIAAAWLGSEPGPHGGAARGVGVAIAAEASGRRVATRGAGVALAAETTGWLVAATGVGQCLAQPWTASAALALAGVICLGVAARPTRRGAAWPALATLYAAWFCWLVAAGVSVVEPYTAPAAMLALAFGVSRSRRTPALSSWPAVGPGLALLLLPSLAVVWTNPGSIRPTLLGVVAAAVALAGARTRRQAPLVMGIVVVTTDAGRALAPAVSLLVDAVPSWIPIAALGAVLLWAGATYEARLRNLRAIRSSLAAMN